MKKKLIGIIIPALIVVLFITVWIVQDNKADTDITRTLYFDENVGVSVIEADMKAYDFDVMISESAVIAYGIVKNLNSYTDDIGRIYSVFDFEISSVEKGNLSAKDTISVYTLGGRTTFVEYIEPQRKDLEETFYVGYVEEQIASNDGNYVESLYAGVPSIQSGDELLLFLAEDVPSPEYELEPFDYFILGSSVQGRYMYDSKINEFYSEKIEDYTNIEKGLKVKKDKRIKNKDFKDKVKKSKDKSKQEKAEREKPPIDWEKETKPGTILIEDNEQN